MKPLIDSPLLYYVEEEPLSEQYRFLKRCISSDRYCVETSTRCLDYAKISKLRSSPELRKWLVWVNKNIILELADDSEASTNVKLRIAVGMLNNLEAKGIIDKLEAYIIHATLTQNVKDEVRNIIVDDLPF